MKVAVILGSFSVGARPLDFNFNNIWSSTRGLTGTDLTTVVISKELAALGHDVSLFTIHAEPNNKPATWENVKLYNLEERFKIVDNTFDAILTINEQNVLINMTTKPLRVCWQFLNDFNYCESGFDNWVDVWLGVCQQHVDYLKAQNKTNPNKWAIVPLGCYPDSYEDKRVPGRVIWTSSNDRGLHWLLQEWTRIKKNVPHAHLKIFYHFNYGEIENITENSDSIPLMKELGQRVRYMKYAIEKLKLLDVEHVGSVSREQMTKELNEASVLAYSCDPVVFSEGFSVSTIESIAAGVVPVITDADCLGSIYKDSGALITKTPIKNNLHHFTNNIIKALNDKEFSDDVIKKCKQFAKEHDWKIIAKKIEQVLRGKHE